MNEHPHPAKPMASSPPADPPAGPGISPQTRAFIRQMAENLNTHQPGVPRGRNTGNCPQPESSPAPPTAPSLMGVTQRSREVGNAKP